MIIPVVWRSKAISSTDQMEASVPDAVIVKLPDADRYVAMCGWFRSALELRTDDELLHLLVPVDEYGQIIWPYRGQCTHTDWISRELIEPRSIAPNGC